MMDEGSDVVRVIWSKLEEHGLARVEDDRLQRLLASGLASFSAWLAERLIVAKGTIADGSPVIALLDLSNEELSVEPAHLDQLLERTSVAGRVAAASLQDTSDVVALHIWVVAPRGAASSAQWNAFRAQVQTDNVACAKNVWLPPSEDDQAHESVGDFFRTGPFAQPWLRGRGGGQQDVLDVDGDLYRGAVADHLFRGSVKKLDTVLRAMGYDNSEPDQRLDRVMAIVAEQEEDGEAL